MGWSPGQNDRLAGASRALGIEPASVIPLHSAAPVARRPRSYLISTGAGARIKIRIARRQDLAARATTLIVALADERVPVPLARVGRFTAEAWVDGTPLSSLRVTQRHVVAAAELLARLHQFPGPPGEQLPRQQSTRPIRRRAERHVVELVSAGLVERRDAGTVRSILRHGLPARAEWGLVHGDFCAENLVWRPDGTLVSIDNETVGRGYRDYDMARTWYRWPMPASTLARFERAYFAALVVASPSPVERLAWRTAAALKGIHLRHRRGLAADRGLAALREVLQSAPGARIDQH
jgi:aminoglycoside phosphotransferase (APT) family kinase protein